MLDFRKLGRAALRWISLAAALCAALFVCFRTPEGWIAVGEKAALLAAGLCEPAETLAFLSRRLNASGETPPAEAAEPETDEQEIEAGVVIPPKTDGGGTVNEVTLSTGTASVGAAAVKNGSGVDYDLGALFAGACPIAFSDTAEPQVLIVHTHTTENYMSYYAGYYNAADEERTTDETKNICAVGESVADGLRRQGICAVHDTTLHDYPQYTGAYERSADTIDAALAAYPGIRLVLDIHRDAMMPDAVTKLKPTATVNGRKAAQMMLVIGATDTASLPNPNCVANLTLGLKLQDRLAAAYGDLMRPLDMVDARYNQDKCVCSLLVEIGTDANTLSEAKYAGELLGESIAALLKPAVS